ncbi:MAG: hypothetical protein ACYS0E_04070 [Planctomycetota bacterium]|jgi:hypothetical protein
MTNRQDIQPLDEGSRDKEAREHGSADENPVERGGIEERIRAAIVRAETELREKRTGEE